MDVITPDSWLFIAVFTLVVLWIIGMIIVFVRLLKKYTLKDWGKEKNPYEKETFAMPRGVMRGTLTLSLLFIVMVMEVINLTIKDAGIEGKIEQLLVAFQMMLAFYFGSKMMHHVTEVDQKKTEANARAAASQTPQSDLDAVG